MGQAAQVSRDNVGVLPWRSRQLTAVLLAAAVAAGLFTGALAAGEWSASISATPRELPPVPAAGTRAGSKGVGIDTYLADR
jgi:hypothetical protein